MVRMGYDFISKDITTPHHQKAIWVLVVSVVIFGLVVVGYFHSAKQTVVPAPIVDNQLTLQALLAQNNPPANLSPNELKTLRTLINSPNPPAKLTGNEIQKRKTLLENI